MRFLRTYEVLAKEIRGTAWQHWGRPGHGLHPLTRAWVSADGKASPGLRLTRHRKSRGLGPGADGECGEGA